MKPQKPSAIFCFEFNCVWSDLPGDGVHGEGIPAGVPALPGQAVRHKKGPDWVRLVSKLNFVYNKRIKI